MVKLRRRRQLIPSRFEFQLTSLLELSSNLFTLDKYIYGLNQRTT